MKRSTCKHCGQSIVQIIRSGWVHEKSLRKLCADGMNTADPR